MNRSGKGMLNWRFAACVMVVCGLAGEGSTGLFAAEDLPNGARAFFGKYCLECHDNATATAKLSLESITADLTQTSWARIHDRLQQGEMPPAEAAQPSPQERVEILRSLSRELTAAARAQQASEGRVALRRMNRREYETTLHDLLGIAEPLQYLLPEDNPVHGFDTVSRGLETSSSHLLRYQQAADIAIEAALPRWPLESRVQRWTGREFLDSRPAPNRAGTEPFARFEGDTIVLCAQLYKHGSVTTPRAPAAGRYRVRVSVRAVQNEGKVIPVLFGKISSDRFQHEKLEHLLDIQDAPADKSRVMEIEAILPAGEQVYVEGVGLPFFLNLKKERNDAPVGDDFAGPGLAVDWIELEGPLDAGLGYRRMFGELEQIPSRYLEDALAGKPVADDWKKWPFPGGEYTKYPLTPVSLDPRGDADRLIRAFLPLAFRRPVSEELAGHYVNIVHRELEQGEPFDEAMRSGYKAILCSPWFINYVERPGKLDDYALAARLARFLWDSLPDEELFAVAASGKLSRPEVLRAQTERMLNDRKGARFARSFTDQWLDLGKFLDMKPDEIYVEYDDMLAWSMPLETRRFFAEVLSSDLPTSTFFHSDWTYLNSRLAKHYAIEGIAGLEMRKASLPAAARRGGVITHASVLKLTTNASYTSPVKRGAWILERILGQPPAPPPPDVKAVEPDIRGATTIREQLDKHKNVAVCASCHVKIDPPGFALENFDVVGGWRERYRVKQHGEGNDYVELDRYQERKVWLAKPVEAGGSLAEGEDFQNIDEYKRLVMQDLNPFTRNLAEKLLVYATGSGIDFADRAVVEQIVADVGKQRHGFRSLIHAVVQSPAFLHK